jgi:hypothetical protein
VAAFSLLPSPREKGRDATMPTPWRSKNEKGHRKQEKEPLIEKAKARMKEAEVRGAAERGR